ncbi:hypothetical protein EGW08_017779, partial [Elysia chlorotica]
VLFAREWRGRFRQIGNALCWCRTRKEKHWLGPGADMCKLSLGVQDRRSECDLQLDDLEAPRPEHATTSGPYIARIMGEEGTPCCGRAIRSERSVRDKIQVFDASKPARAGRRVDRLLTQPRQGQNGSGAGQKSNLEAEETDPTKPRQAQQSNAQDNHHHHQHHHHHHHYLSPQQQAALKAGPSPRPGETASQALPCTAGCSVWSTSTPLSRQPACRSGPALVSLAPDVHYKLRPEMAAAQ